MARAKWVPEQRQCPTCTTVFTQGRYGQVYCKPECRPRQQSWRNADRKPKASPAERGYGSEHKQTRAKWKPAVDRLEVECWRCGELITPDPTIRGGGWDLGHDDEDRTIYRGPEHSSCNRATKTHTVDARSTSTPAPVRHWIL